MTEQEQIEEEFDRRTRRATRTFWPIYIVLLSLMIFVTIKGCV